MSLTLLKTELKSNVKMSLIFMALITLYGTVITLMFDPDIGQGMNELAKSMPELFAAFGMKDPGSTMLDFLINYLYGFILILIPFVFSILLSYTLVARYMDQGSMAYLLNTKYGRKAILQTQIVVFVLEHLILMIYTTALLLFCSTILMQESLDFWCFLYLNIGLFCLHIFLGSLCFFTACVFNEVRYSIGCGAGIGFLFLLIQMLSDVNEDFNFLNYLTPLRLFSPEKIIEYEGTGFIGVLIIFVVGFGFLVLGKICFSKRDLPL